jgi:hypothetical protein
MQELTFTGNKYEFLISSIHRVIPGAEKILSVSIEEAEYCFRIKHKDEEINEFDPRERPYWYSIFKKYRIGSTRFDWLSPADIPVDDIPARKEKRDLFSEENNVVLLVRILSKEDHLSDLIFIHFRKNLSTFGLSHIDESFKTDHKALAGYLISNFLHQLSNSFDQNLGSFIRQNENVRMIIRHNEENIARLKNIRMNYGESLLTLCRTHLEELSVTYRRNFVLAEDAIEKIRNYSGNISLLKLILEDAVSFVNQVYFDEDELDIKIHGWELNFEKFIIAEKYSQETHRIDNRESRAMQLLDKLEKSAEEVLRNRMPLTSANVGQFCPTPISAPAITDALKKNRKRVNMLLEKYPEKWRLIRNQFRPVLNIREKKKEGDAAAST